MVKEKKGRGGFYERDLLKKVTKEYHTALGNLWEIFRQIASGTPIEKGNKPIKSLQPSFVDIIFLPVIAKLAEMLPEYDVDLPQKEEIEPDDKGHFRVSIGGRTVVGITFGGPEAQFINVTLFTSSNRSWGEPLQIDNMKDLKKLIETVAHIRAISKTNVKNGSEEQ